MTAHAQPPAPYPYLGTEAMALLAVCHITSLLCLHMWTAAACIGLAYLLVVLRTLYVESRRPVR